MSRQFYSPASHTLPQFLKVWKIIAELAIIRAVCLISSIIFIYLWKQWPKFNNVISLVNKYLSVVVCKHLKLVAGNHDQNPLPLFAKLPRYYWSCSKLDAMCRKLSPTWSQCPLQLRQPIPAHKNLLSASSCPSSNCEGHLFILWGYQWNIHLVLVRISILPDSTPGDISVHVTVFCQPPSQTERGSNQIRRRLFWGTGWLHWGAHSAGT